MNRNIRQNGQAGSDLIKEKALLHEERFLKNLYIIVL